LQSNFIIVTYLKKLFIPLLFAGLLLLPFTGCEVTRQARLASNLANCEFRILSVENVIMGGVSLQNIKSVKDLSFSDVALLMAGLTSPVFPLSLQLNLEGRNPNTTAAGLNHLDWILFIDDNQMASGMLDKPFSIPPKGTTLVPVQIGLDLKPFLSGKSAETILNFGMNLAGMGNAPTRLKIKLKPTIIVGGTVLRYPGYITVNTTYISR
jgi:hypothetical protein